MATLTVYIEDNSAESARVLDFLGFLKTIAPGLDLRLVNVSRSERAPELGDVALPAFEIDGTVIPGQLPREQLHAILRALAERNLN